MHKNLINILRGLQDRTSAEDADIGRLIVFHSGVQRRTIMQYHDFLTENKLIWRTGAHKYRVDRKKIRKMLIEGGGEENAK